MISWLVPALSARGTCTTHSNCCDHERATQSVANSEIRGASELWKRRYSPTFCSLVINAGLLPQLSSVTDIDQASWNKALTVNLLATQALLAQFDSMLRRSEDPRVIGMTSSVATMPRAYWGAYASTKAAFEVLLDCYAQEVRNVSKIRVAILNPGATRTAMRARAYPGEDPASVKPPEAVAAHVVSLLGERFASPHRDSVNLVP